MKINDIKKLFRLKKETCDYIDMETIVTGGFNHKDKGWIKVEIHPDIRKEWITKMVELLGGRSNTKAKITNNLIMGNNSYWLKRFHIERFREHNKPYKYHISFCSGQSYPDEIREARNELK